MGDGEAAAFLGPEDPEGVSRGQIAQVERHNDRGGNSDRTITVRIPGLTGIAAHCLVKALRLARELNHPEVSIAHFIVAMTVLPAAGRQFTMRGLDPDGAFRASMEAIANIERVGISPDEPPLSLELTSLLRDAARNAEIRDNQEASIDDILGVALRFTFDVPVRKLIAGVRIVTPAEEARDAVRKLGNDIMHRLDAVEARLAAPRSEVKESVPPGLISTITRQLGTRRGRP